MKRRDAKSRPLRLLAYFGSDIDPKSLARAHRKGFALLALDTVAIDSAVQANVPYTLIEDWVDGERIGRTQEQAADWEKKWLLPAKEKLRVDGVCWPEFDSQALVWFWRDMALSVALVEALRERQVRELRLICASQPRPKIYYFRSDVSAVFLQSEFAGCASLWRESVWRRALSRAGSSLSRARSKLGNLRPRRSKVASSASADPAGEVFDPVILKRKVVFAFNPGEYHRFTTIASQLAQAFPGQVAAALVHQELDVAEKIRTVWELPVVCLPLGIASGSALGERFFHGFSEAREAAYGEAWHKVLEHLSYHFEFYCRERWPKLVATLGFWSQLWRTAQPAAVLVSSLADAESQLPAVAAQRLRIPTFSLPHGALTQPGLLESVDYVLYELMLQRKMYDRVGVSQERLVCCRDLSVINEYPTERGKISRVDCDTWRVIAFTGAIQYPGTLAPGHSVAAQSAALQTLARVPQDLSQKLSLHIKVHPGSPQLELFASAASGLREMLLPLDADLSEALEQSDLVILINTAGSVFAHSVRAGKPILFFWTDPLMARPELHADLVVEAGVVVRTPRELWRQIREFFTCSSSATALRAKSAAFRRENLDSDDFPTLSEVVGRSVS